MGGGGFGSWGVLIGDGGDGACDDAVFVCEGQGGPEELVDPHGMRSE